MGRSAWGGEYPKDTPVGRVINEKNGGVPLSAEEYRVGAEIYNAGWTIQRIVDETGATTFIVYQYVDKEQSHFVGDIPDLKGDALNATNKFGDDLNLSAA
jgi:hypothetical protein